MYKILLENGKFCTGCGACANACPTEVIEMKNDEYGFPQAVINKDKCIQCNVCKSICPVLKEKIEEYTDKPQCKAVMAENKIRFRSSSGGAFYVFAKNVLQQGGLVAGAALEDRTCRVKHILVSKVEELAQLQKSKYTQSEIGNIYKEIEHHLKDEKKILFTGCPCQVAGLKSYLKKEYENLLLVDIICHGVPSQKMLMESLTEYNEKESVIGMDFRDKDYGWECLGLTLKYSDGTKRRISYDESRYEQGFHPGMTLRDSCYNCKFCEYPREGDISIGDFWGIEEFDDSLNDGRGTSIVLINSSKGKKFFEKIEQEFMVCKDVPLKYAEKNRVHAETHKDNGREYFLSLYPKRDFNTSVLYAQQEKYDIGIVGNWSYPNYGSELTYYALYRVLKNMNKSVVMISWPKAAKWKPYEAPQLFAENPYQAYEIAPLVETRQDMIEFNNKCDTFVLGSDQLLNNNLYNWFDKFMQFDWVQDNKSKIAYAASFGCDYIWGSDDDRAEMALFLQKFDAVSVREKSAVDLLDKYYGVKSDVVMDPIFLISEKEYAAFAEKYEKDLSQKEYMFSYILDVSKEKADIIKYGANQLGIDVIAARDGSSDNITESHMWDIPTVYNLKVEEWLAYIKNCKFMITDSFHGMCFAIIFKKPFIAISNSERGKTRFDTILEYLDLQEHLVNSEEEFKRKVYLFEKTINYTIIKKRLEEQTEKSKKWLEKALLGDEKIKKLSEYDIVSKRIWNHGLRIDGIDATNDEQWKQLEDHRLRLDGIDTTNDEQWKQLEDHRLRLDGIDATNDEQWKQLEDHRLRLDGIDATNHEQWKQLEDCKIKLMQLDEQLQVITKSHSYRLGRFITYIPRMIVKLLKSR